MKVVNNESFELVNKIAASCDHLTGDRYLLGWCMGCYDHQEKWNTATHGLVKSKEYSALK